MAKKKFIQQAIKRPGALRAKAKRAGLVKGDEPLSKSDLDKLAAKGGTRTKRQVALARTLKGPKVSSPAKRAKAARTRKKKR